MSSPIIDVNSYNNSMAAAIQDKLYFLPLLKDEGVRFVVDYGCADGTLIAALAPKYPHIKFIGVDNSEYMIYIAQSKTKGMNNVSFCFGDQNFLREFDSCDSSDTLVIFNSVLHEVFSYSKNNSSAEFWEILTQSNFRYVCVRDMYVSPRYKETWAWAQNEYVEIKRSELYQNDAAFRGRLMDFFSHYEMNDYNMIMFLLKFRYAKNWIRERDENYSPYMPGSIVSLLDRHYYLIMWDDYALPYNVEKINELFHFDIGNIKTHYKLVFANPKYDVITSF